MIISFMDIIYEERTCVEFHEISRGCALHLNTAETHRPALSYSVGVQGLAGKHNLHVVEFCCRQMKSNAQSAQIKTFQEIISKRPKHEEKVIVNRNPKRTSPSCFLAHGSTKKKTEETDLKWFDQCCGNMSIKRKKIISNTSFRECKL